MKPEPQLPAAGWYPANRAQIVQWAPSVPDAPLPRVAVFDWDNTCICNDIGDATWRHQLDRLLVRLSPDALRDLLPASRVGVTTLSDGCRLADLATDIVAAHATLYPAIARGDTSAVLGSPAHLDFRAKLGSLYVAMEATPGLGAHVAYPWLARFLDGFAPEEVEALAWGAWQLTAAQRVGEDRWESATAGASGPRRFTFRRHVAAHPEMRDLMAMLRTVGFGVYVVTASAESVVRGVAPRLGFPLEPDHILGMRPPSDTYPLTYRQGKVTVIERFLPAPPLLVAGDTNTDFEMLTAFSETQVRLIINRNSVGDIRTLYAAAFGPSQGSVLTLLQGRDENRAAFCPSRETVPLGEQQPRALGSA